MDAPAYLETIHFLTHAPSLPPYSQMGLGLHVSMFNCSFPKAPNAFVSWLVTVSATYAVVSVLQATRRGEEVFVNYGEGCRRDWLPPAAGGAPGSAGDFRWLAPAARAMREPGGALEQASALVAEYQRSRAALGHMLAQDLANSLAFQVEERGVPSGTGPAFLRETLAAEGVGRMCVERFLTTLLPPDDFSSGGGAAAKKEEGGGATA